MSKLSSWLASLRQKMINRKKLTFLFADDFLSMLLVYKAVWIQGRYGGGKTSLGVILAAWLLKMGHVKHVRSNFPCSLSTDIIDLELLYDEALVVDETNAFIGDRKTADGYANYLRKTNYYLIMPSVMPPHIKLTKFAVQRMFNGYRYGIPIWVYKWTLNYGNIREKGNFAILNPDAVFGAYDTGAIPMSDGGISDGIERTIKFEQWVTYIMKGKTPTPERKSELKSLYENSLQKGVELFDSIPVKSDKKKGSKSSAKPIEENSDNDEILDALQDTAEEIAAASGEMREAAGKIRRSAARRR
jgi:hypothetical protein